MRAKRRWILTILPVVALLALPLGGAGEGTSQLDQLVRIAEKVVLSATEAVERAQVAGQEEADQLTELLVGCQAEIEAFKQAEGEVAALAGMVRVAAMQVQEIADRIVESAEEDAMLAKLMPLASTAAEIALEAVPKAQAAAERAAKARQEVEATVQALAQSMTSLIAPSPATAARQQAALAEGALADAQAAAAEVAEAVANEDFDAAVTALDTVVGCETSAWKAAWAAEAVLNELTSGIGEWRLTLWRAGRESIAAFSEAMAASCEVNAVLGIMESLVSTGLVSIAPEPEVLPPEEPDEAAPIVQASDLRELASGNSAFAFDLYQALRDEAGNLFYSPYSISLALAMVYAGARGDTEQQMAGTLHFTLPQDRLHPAFGFLDLELTSRGEGGEGQDGEPFQLHIANSLWRQIGYQFLPEFLSVLAENYRAELGDLDFQNAPEDSRGVINDWVSDQTEEKIQDLIPAGGITPLTRLVLANAIYFNAAWHYPFPEWSTQDGEFHLVDDSSITVPMMAQEEWFGYAAGSGYQGVELLYCGEEVSMVILVPDAGRFEEFESSIDDQQVTSILADIEKKNVLLTMPRFSYDSSFGLGQTLVEMGMTDAFSANADFSGMDGTRNLFIDEVYHKAFVSVDEQGTEAAAATAVVMAELAMPEPEPCIELTIDRPFIFLIRDIETNTILFVGRVVDPS